jgi:hypothetical protein
VIRVLLLIVVLLLPGIAVAQVSRAAPRMSPAMLAVTDRANGWARVGNYDQALRLISAFATSPAATAFDRYKVNRMAAYYYRRLRNTAAAISADRSTLASPFFATESPTEMQASAGRRQILLQLAEDELSLGRFTAAADDASRVLTLARAAGPFPPGGTDWVGDLAKQIQQHAQQRNRTIPASTANAGLHLHVRPVVDPSPPVTPQQQALVCASVLAHANDSTLAALDVSIASAPPGAAAGDSLVTSNATRLDLFGDGKPVYLATQDFGNSSPAEIEVLDARGTPVRPAESSDTNWGRIEDEGADETLIQVSGHFYLLGTVNGQAQYVQAFAQNRVTHVLCEFTAVIGAAKPQIRVMTPFERLAADVAYQWPQSPADYADYVLVAPGTEAAGTLLDAVGPRYVSPPHAPLPSLYNSNGTSLLTLAIRFSRDDIVGYLLEHGLAANLPDHPGPAGSGAETPLDEAVDADDVTAVSLLLAYGAKPDDRDMSEAFQQRSVTMLHLLLAHGGHSKFGPVDISHLIQRQPDAQDLAAKIDLLLRAGADPDLWASTLFDAIANRSGLAPARTLLEREGGCTPESAKYISVETEWVQALLSNPTRAPDNGLEPLLREATALRDAALRHGSVRLQPATCGHIASKRDAFLAYAAGILRQRLPPGYSVTPDAGSPSVLILDGHGAKIGHVDMGLQYLLCPGPPANCFASVTQWALAAENTLEDFSAPPDPRDLYVVASPRSLFESELAPRPASAPAVPMRPCLPNLVCVLLAKRDTGLRFVNVHDLAEMRLTEDSAFHIATANTRRRLESLPLPVPPSAEQPIRFVNYDQFESSLLLLHADWSSLAKATGGRLLVAIPAGDLVVYAADAGPGSVAAFTKFVADCLPSAKYRLSPLIFRWRPDGWALVR